MTSDAEFIPIPAPEETVAIIGRVSAESEAEAMEIRTAAEQYLRWFRTTDTRFRPTACDYMADLGEQSQEALESRGVSKPTTYATETGNNAPLYLMTLRDSTACDAMVNDQPLSVFNITSFRDGEDLRTVRVTIHQILRTTPDPKDDDLVVATYLGAKDGVARWVRTGPDDTPLTASMLVREAIAQAVEGNRPPELSIVCDHKLRIQVPTRCAVQAIDPEYHEIQGVRWTVTQKALVPSADGEDWDTEELTPPWRHASVRYLPSTPVLIRPDYLGDVTLTAIATDELGATTAETETLRVDAPRMVTFGVQAGALWEPLSGRNGSTLGVDLLARIEATPAQEYHFGGYARMATLRDGYLYGSAGIQAQLQWFQVPGVPDVIGGAGVCMLASNLTDSPGASLGFSEHLGAQWTPLQELALPRYLGVAERGLGGRSVHPAWGLLRLLTVSASADLCLAGSQVQAWAGEPWAGVALPLSVTLGFQQGMTLR